jgi:hypothetical protein
MSKGYSDSYLQQLWRQAVKSHWGDRCAKCGSSDVQCHHIVKRRRAMLRNDWHNGIPLCHACHNWIETMAGRLWLADKLEPWHKEYLMLMDKDIKQHLTEAGMTRAEFDKLTAEELKRKIKEYD